jgi:hypothetical protein
MGTSALRFASTPDLNGGQQRQRIIDAMIDSCAEKTYARRRRHRHRRPGPHLPQHLLQAVRRQARLLRRRGQPLHRAAPGGSRLRPVEEEEPADAVRKATTAVIEALAERPGLAQLLTGDAIAVEPQVIECYRKATIPALEALWARSEGSAKAHSDPRLAFGKAQVLILNQIAIGEADRLPELLPEIVYLAVSPFGGHEAALRQSQLAGESTTSDVAAGER